MPCGNFRSRIKLTLIFMMLWIICLCLCHSEHTRDTCDGIWDSCIEMHENCPWTREKGGDLVWSLWGWRKRKGNQRGRWGSRSSALSAHFLCQAFPFGSFVEMCLQKVPRFFPSLPFLFILTQLLLSLILWLWISCTSNCMWFGSLALLEIIFLTPHHSFFLLLLLPSLHHQSQSTFDLRFLAKRERENN